jgi:hypothetical protein
VQIAITDLGWVDGTVMGVTVHGLLEDVEILGALFGKKPRISLDSALDALTDKVMANLDAAFIEDLAGLATAKMADRGT